MLLTLMSIEHDPVPVPFTPHPQNLSP